MGVSENQPDRGLHICRGAALRPEETDSNKFFISLQKSSAEFRLPG
jgi:hypothetical protein